MASATHDSPFLQTKEPRWPNHKAFQSSGRYAKSSKVADAVIKALGKVFQW
jgi:hypothetical protein